MFKLMECFHIVPMMLPVIYNLNVPVIFNLVIESPKL